MFCSSHIVGRLGPWPLPGSPQGLFPSASYLHCVSKGTLGWQRHVSWEVAPNRDREFPPPGRKLSVLPKRRRATDGNNRQTNRCGSVLHDMPLTRLESLEEARHLHMCEWNGRQTHTHGRLLGGPAVCWNNRKHHNCQHFMIQNVSALGSVFSS